MTLHKPTLMELLSFYRNRTRMGVSVTMPKRAITSMTTTRGGVIGSHIVWMADEIEKGDMSDEKIMRWVCFMQGALWAIGMLSIDEAKLHNYQLLNEGAQP